MSRVFASFVRALSLVDVAAGTREQHEGQAHDPGHQRSREIASNERPGPSLARTLPRPTGRSSWAARAGPPAMARAPPDRSTARPDHRPIGAPPDRSTADGDAGADRDARTDGRVGAEDAPLTDGETSTDGMAGTDGVPRANGRAETNDDPRGAESIAGVGRARSVPAAQAVPPVDGRSAAARVAGLVGEI